MVDIVWNAWDWNGADAETEGREKAQTGRVASACIQMQATIFFGLGEFVTGSI